MAEPTFKNLRELDQNFFQGQFSIISNFQPNFLLDTTPLSTHQIFLIVIRISPPYLAEKSVVRKFLNFILITVDNMEN